MGKKLQRAMETLGHRIGQDGERAAVIEAIAALADAVVEIERRFDRHTRVGFASGTNIPADHIGSERWP